MKVKPRSRQIEAHGGVNQRWQEVGSALILVYDQNLVLERDCSQTGARKGMHAKEEHAYKWRETGTKESESILTNWSDEWGQDTEYLQRGHIFVFSNRDEQRRRNAKGINSGSKTIK